MLSVFCYPPRDENLTYRLLAGTIDDPIIVNGAGDEQYAGCTGYPVDSHQVIWLTVR